MNDRALTLELASTLGVAVTDDALAPLFALAPELVEWSINAGPDPRGTLRVAAWTRDRARVARVIPPEHAAMRDHLLCGDDFEGLGLALHPDQPPAARWWLLASEGAELAARARAAWPHHAAELAALLAAAGGDHALTAVGAELPGRETAYVRLADAAAAVRVLELAQVPVSRQANLFWKGICGLEPGGRAWPQVWAGHSIGRAGGWKFYYFARGDELRRTDAVLLDAVGAAPELRAACALVGGNAAIQLIGLTVRDRPSFTVYLGRL